MKTSKKTRSAEVDLGKLCSSIRASRKVLEPFRVSRRESVRKYAGDQWSTETTYVNRPINFLSLYLQIVSRNLIAHDPRVQLTTKKKQYRAPVSAMEDWVNPEIKKMGLANSLFRGGIDALYGFHAMKVALATPAESEKRGWNLSIGGPYAAVIDLDDWCMDPHARTLEELAWCGHRSRVRIDSITDSKLYDAAKRKKLSPNQDKQYNQSGDMRVSMLGRQFISNDTDEAYEYCDLWEIYLPMEKMILTLLSEDGGDPNVEDFQGSEAPFAQRDWVGPPTGPYHFLNLMPPVSGNAMMKGPIQDLIDMDECMNGLTQKLIEQSARQKEVLAASGAADQDAQRIVEARDGEVIRVDNVDKLKPMGFGGPNNMNQAFSLHLWEMLNKLSGNLELLGGLGQQSRTATQDKMLNANSSVSMNWMQQAMVKHTSSVVSALCWYWHHHPQKVMTAYRDIPGLSAPIERKLTPKDRSQVPFEAMEIQVDPYSLQYQSPEQRLGFLNTVVTQTIMPMMPVLQQQGINFNVSRFLELISEYGNSPDLLEIVEVATAPEAPQDDGGDQQSMKPVNSTRTYNRVNQSEATSGGQSKAMQQALVGQSAGGNQNNTSFKPSGGQ